MPNNCSTTHFQEMLLDAVHAPFVAGIVSFVARWSRFEVLVDVVHAPFVAGDWFFEERLLDFTLLWG